MSRRALCRLAAQSIFFGADGGLKRLAVRVEERHWLRPSRTGAARLRLPLLNFRLALSAIPR